MRRPFAAAGVAPAAGQTPAAAQNKNTEPMVTLRTRMLPASPLSRTRGNDRREAGVRLWKNFDVSSKGAVPGHEHVPPVDHATLANFIQQTGAARNFERRCADNLSDPQRSMVLESTDGSGRTDVRLRRASS
jgi:hypothetical protein